MSVDMDECASDHGNCHEYADCVNSVGSYRCNCQTGFTGTGLDCTGTLLKLNTHTPEIVPDAIWCEKNRRRKSTCTTQKLITNNKIKKLYKQNENNVIDQSISPVTIVVSPEIGMK